MNNVEYTSDRVDVVRCKDCKHCYYASNRVEAERYYVCAKDNGVGEKINPDWFCADGERREDDDGNSNNP